jgi:hypothetical protein
MADTVAPTGVAATASVGLGVMGGTNILKWVFVCIQSGQVMMPDDATIGLMAAVLAPLIHSAYLIIMARLNRLAVLPAATVAIVPPQAGE